MNEATFERDMGIVQGSLHDDTVDDTQYGTMLRKLCEYFTRHRSELSRYAANQLLQFLLGTRECTTRNIETDPFLWSCFNTRRCTYMLKSRRMCRNVRSADGRMCKMHQDRVEFLRWNLERHLISDLANLTLEF